MNFREFLKQNIVVLDGSTGTMLQSMGLKTGENTESYNTIYPEKMQQLHKAYYDAGSNVVCTNSFGANLLHFEMDELEKIITVAVENVKKARDESIGSQPKFVAFDLGPSGKLLKPFGDYEFEQAVELFSQSVKIAVSCGVDLIVIETMNDSLETKAAVIAVKENCNLPFIVSNAYGEDSKLVTGASPEAMATMLEALGADAVGANCSLGPKALFSVTQKLLDTLSIPAIFMPNAGMPQNVDGKTVYNVSPEEFSKDVFEMVKKGVRIVGGCCGTTPLHIQKTVELINGFKPLEITEKNQTAVSSYTHSVSFKNAPIIIGERINPTGKKRFKQALLENDIDFILSEGISQEEKGADILDVNVGLPEIDEAALLKIAVTELQAVVTAPLQIDTSDIEAMEKALRCYNGKAMINSVNGKEQSMNAVFPLVKKYGGVVVALTLDENGIPNTAEGRVDIARKILKTAEKFGINKKDIIFDPLAMAVSANKNAAMVTLDAVKQIREDLGCHTSLGVSNISFGLPARNVINSTFYALALENGLSAAILNPLSEDMMRVYYSYRVLNNLDNNCEDYIKAAQSFSLLGAASVQKSDTQQTEGNLSPLQTAVCKGLKERAAAVTAALLKEKKPLDIVANELIPALDIVGVGYENKTVYLPQLLMSAEAAKSAFEEIKKAVLNSGEKSNSRGKIVIATVKGDIHDIGKNIVKLLLENYGFNVIDLGKDVAPQAVVDAAVKENVRLVGLSALMTTTLPAMEQTIMLLNARCPDCKTVVGGAVLTEDYAKKIGADKYSKDAMQTVRYAEEILK